MMRDRKIDFIPRERLGIFLIVASFWYLINIKIFNALHPILAIPGSLIFITGLWLSPSLPIPTTKTSTYVTTEPPVQAPTKPAAEATPTPVSKPKQKPTKIQVKAHKKTKPSKK